MLIAVCAACLLDEQQRLLLVRKRGTTALMLPGGKPEPGETPSNALRRELREELSLELPEESLEYLGTFRAMAANEEGYEVEARIFLGQLRQTVAPAAELEALRWLAARDPLPDEIAPLLREQVLPALRQTLPHWQPHQGLR